MEFTPEHYLDCITLPKYRVSISKIRAKSHDLEIERGRYARPKVDPDHRLFTKKSNQFLNELHLSRL